MMRCAVLGDPIQHSLSPVIHRAAYDAMGLDWEYDAVLVAAGHLAGFVDDLDPGRWRGLSLTAPLKREAVPLLTSHDAWVDATSVCNTLLFEEDGSRHGLNTDVTGAMAVLEAHDGAVERAVVLGGGATATSVLLALAERGMRHATLAVREPARAAETVHAVVGHGAEPQVEVVELAEVSVLSGDVLVSTVPASAQTPDVLAATADVPLVFEVIYEPWPSPLAAAAQRGGRTVINGLDLLLAQAADQLRAMTGRDDVPLEAMREAAEAELAARAKL